MRNITLTCFLLFTATLSFAQKQKEQHLKVSNKYSIGQQVSDEEYTVTLKQIRKISDSTFLMQIQVNDIYYSTVDNRFNITLSTAHPSKNRNIQNTTATIPYVLLYGRPIQFEVTNGKVKIDSLKLRSELLRQLTDWQITPEYQSNILANTISKSQTMAQYLFFSKEKSKLTGQIQKKDKNQASFIRDENNTAEKTQEKTIFDIHTFQITEASLTTKVDQDVNNKGVKSEFYFAVQPSSLPSVKSDAEKNYLVMIIEGSGWSQAVMTNNEIDSIKLKNYISKYDPLYGERPDFNSIKLGLIQRQGNYETYKEELKKTRPFLLKSTYHLSNKIVFDDLSEADFIEIVPLLDNEQLYSWAQNDLYQHVLAGKSEAINKLSKLSVSFSEREKTTATPMILWHKAFLNKNHADSLLYYGNALLALDPSYWNDGNASRYALFICKLLGEKDKSTATAFLDQIIKKLTPLAEDEQNSYRIVKKAHLAYCYYLHAAEADPAQALAYTEKAVFYSHENKNEDRRVNSYERSFGVAKENYNEKYLDMLAQNGQKDLALQNYVKEFLINHSGNFSGLKNFYEKQFDSVSFGQYFKDKIIPQLADAPAFELTDLEENNVNIAQFKGKWTVIDFWGTWCGPCVAEMPRLNTYHEKLKEDDKSKIDFITIACNDTKEKVETFLAKNKFTIPVLMSDEKVQYSYKVPGYPSKFIVTPEGKLIPTMFGSDWQGFVKQLATLY
ncbi:MULTISPECIES: TlpA family protein disulfide reductase [unclassified Sphingobacterium]|uniref:TlpA family protein disulfide reductase n=1 Tax=unclassified Sphingobacterium TaxID=2609468 RepID=UPI0025E14977|nr:MULTISPECIES: TlpA disulfide reductase family protein [unclassified Sphingobacterium]